MTTEVPTKKTRKWPWFVGGGVVLLITIGIINSPAPTTTTYSNTPAPASVPAPVPVAASPNGPVTAIGEGTYEIGTGNGQVPPGTYRTAGPTSTGALGYCYWARAKDTSGNVEALIANDNIKGPTTVTISSTDGAFQTSSCMPWTKVR